VLEVVEVVAVVPTPGNTTGERVTGVRSVGTGDEVRAMGLWAGAVVTVGVPPGNLWSPGRSLSTSTTVTTGSGRPGTGCWPTA
jgi:hypothetical protein